MPVKSLHQSLPDYRFPGCSNNSENMLRPRHKTVHLNVFPDSKVHWTNMGHIWGRQDPGGPHVGPMNIWVTFVLTEKSLREFILSYRYTFLTIISRPNGAYIFVHQQTIPSRAICVLIIFCVSSTQWVWLCRGQIVVKHPICLFPFVSHQSENLFMYSYFNIWPWKSKVKIMDNIKRSGPMVDSAFNRCTSPYFPIDPTNSSWEGGNWNLPERQTHQMGAAA